MSDWLRSLRRNWDALLAFTLVFGAVGLYFGPGYYFLLWYVVGCAYFIQVALKR
ncbi:MAG: hypothetical protein WEB52_02030 [Dehalococcoidia bacterium]